MKVEKLARERQDGDWLQDWTDGRSWCEHDSATHT